MKISARMKAGLENTGKAMQGVPDRVPVLGQINEHARNICGRSPKEYYSDADLFFRSQLLVSEYYGLDFPATEYYDMYNIEAEALGQPLKWFDDMMPEVDHTRKLVTGPRDIDGLRPPDTKKSGRMPFVLELKRKALESGFVPGIRYCAPFSLAVNICGMQNLIIGLMSDPASYHRLFAFLADEVISPWIVEQRSLLGQDLEAMGADAYASLPNTNVEILEEFCLPYIQRLKTNVGKVSSRGWWGESYLTGTPDKLSRFMGMKLNLSPSYYLALDPDVTKMGVSLFKDYATQNRTPLMIGIGATDLENGTVETILERTREIIGQGAAGGRFLILLNDLPKDVSPVNIHAAVHGVKTYGAYPLDRSAGEIKPFDPSAVGSFSDFAAKFGD